MQNAEWRAGKVFRWDKYNDKPELLIDEATNAGLNMLFIMDRYFTMGSEKNQALIKLAEAEGIKVFIIFQTFYNDAVVIDSSISALDMHGNMVKDNWLSFICPNEDTYKKRRLSEIVDLVSAIKPHGISLDFFRYFVYWEAGEDWKKVETCFCKRCLTKLEKQFSISVNPEQILQNYAKEWANFKCGTIIDYAAQIHVEIKTIDPEILFNLHVVPWKQTDYNGAIITTAAQDLSSLSEYFDFFQPMTYSSLLNESIEWAYGVGVDMASHFPDIFIIPCIQTPDANTENVKIISAPPVQGYSIWPFEKF